VARVPGLRESLTWNFTVVLRRQEQLSENVHKEDAVGVSLHK
jgi:hypothetical protein